MNQGIIDDIAYVIEVDPRLEVILFGPYDLTDHELKENSSGSSTNITFGDVVNPSIPITSMIGWFVLVDRTSLESLIRR